MQCRCIFPLHCMDFFNRRYCIMFFERFKKTIIVFCFLLAVSFGFVPSAFTAGSSVEIREVTPQEAFEMYQNDRGSVKILDVRTTAEYSLIGHPKMAYNIPVQLWAGEYDSSRRDYPLAVNSKFVAQVKSRFSLDKTILLICRSGARSRYAAKLLLDAGLPHVFTISEGFEGDKVKDLDNVFYSQRMKNGWRLSGLPWTYNLSPKLIYSPNKNEDAQIN